MEYQRKIRNKQIERAKRIIVSNKVNDLKKNANDARRFIKKVKKENEEYILNKEKIAEEEKYDGYYAIATNLDAPKEAKGKTSKSSSKGSNHCTFYDMLYSPADIQDNRG